MVDKGYHVLGHFERANVLDRLFQGRWKRHWIAQLEAFGKTGVMDTFDSTDVRGAMECKNVFFDEHTMSQVIEEML